MTPGSRSSGARPAGSVAAATVTATLASLAAVVAVTTAPGAPAAASATVVPPAIVLPAEPIRTSGQERAVERVVSVVPAATETLFALGAGDRVVGVGSYDTWPPDVLELPQVGAYLDPNFERIVSLRPDLVVLDAGQDAMTRKLRNAGVATLAYRHGDLEVAFEMMAALGEAVGMPEAGHRLAERVGARLEALAARHGEGPRPRVLLVFGRGGGFRNLWVVGGTGFLHQLLEIAGGDNLFADVGHDSFKAGLEAVLARRPDVVLEIAQTGERPAPDAETLAGEWRALPGLGGVRVEVLAADHVGRPGPRMPESVRLMAAALHGEPGSEKGDETPW